MHNVALKTLFVIFVSVLLFSCAAQKDSSNTDNRVKTLIEYRDRVSVDTTYVRDSVIVRERGDTVYVTRDRTHYRERLRVDSVYVDRVDSVFIESVERVQLKPTFLDRVKYAFPLSLLFFALLLLLLFIWRK